MSEVGQIAEVDISRHKGFKRVLFLASFAFILMMSLFVFSSGSSKVLAAGTNVCGINTGNVKDYAGMVVYMQWATAANPTTYNTAHGVTATVTDLTQPAGVANIVQYPNTASMTRQSSVTLSQINGNCVTLDGANTYDDPVVLAYTTGADTADNGGYGSPGSDGAPYVLDCDDLLTNGTLSTFTVTANGVPNGAPAGGTWTTWHNSTPNGFTTYVVLTYTPPKASVPISGYVDTKVLPNGQAVALAGAVMGVDDNTNGKFYSSAPSTASGYYSVSVPAGDSFTIGVESATVPTGYSGPWTDYKGGTAFTATSDAYDCTSSQYESQISGIPQSTPSSGGCEVVAADSDYNFIYVNSAAQPNTGLCTNLSSSGTSPTFTVKAGYSVASGVSYKSASFDWGDGSAPTSGTNSGGAVTAGPHTYTTNGTYTVTATLSFSSSSTSVPNSSCSTTVTVGSPTTPGGGSSPGYTCTDGGGAYNIQYQTTPAPTGNFIGAGYPATSISFSSTGGFDSDAAHGISLAPYPDQTSSLTITGDGQLGLASDGPIAFTGSNSDIVTLPMTNSAGMYTDSVNYSAEIVTVTEVPPEVKTPQPAAPAGYTSAPTQATTSTFTTTTAGASPTITYYTTEVATTVYTYSKTTTTQGIIGYEPCPTNWTSDGALCTRIETNGTPTSIGATPIYGPISATTTATTQSTDTTHWVTVATVPAPCPTGSIDIADQPYMKVYGGDVMAGSGFNSGSQTNCTEPTSSIIGWNWPQPPSYGGAGDEFAAYGLGQIDGFATNQASSTATGIGLSFANTANNSPSGQDFGGSFGQVNCAPDFYDTMPASPTSPVPTVSSLQSKSYYNNGNLTINGGNVQDSQHPVIYVNGNVYISNNIYLGSTTTPTRGESWASVSDIPSFELIVKGDIYIDPGVTNLDGIYVAQGGTIYDCATSIGPELGSQYYNTCNNQLVVNGSFIASNVDLMRTANTLYQSGSDTNVPTSTGSQDNSNAAEVFNYNPVIWLGLTSNNTSLDNYNSVISLPPVL